jgi:hypothetical protein
MQEKLNDELRVFPWEVYFFEEGAWSRLQAFDNEDDARLYYNDVTSKSTLPKDFYALIGPGDKVMPMEPASYRQ